jgi:hypothetical protein
MVFYKEDNQTLLDKLMYHFIYIALLLAGAIDAQMRIAHRAYKIKGKERFSSPRNKDFLKKLQTTGAEPLAQLLKSKKTQALLSLIYDIRNTIHGAWIPSIHKPSFEEFPKNVLELDWESWEKIFLNAEFLGMASSWGLQKQSYYKNEMKPENKRTRIELEPFSYSCKLLQEGFQLIDLIAQNTEIERLFWRSEVPVLTGAPSEDERLFSKETQNFLKITG